MEKMIKNNELDAKILSLYTQVKEPLVGFPDLEEKTCEEVREELTELMEKLKNAKSKRTIQNSK